MAEFDFNNLEEDEDSEYINAEIEKYKAQGLTNNIDFEKAEEERLELEQRLLEEGRILQEEIEEQERKEKEELERKEQEECEEQERLEREEKQSQKKYNDDDILSF